MIPLILIAAGFLMLAGSLFDWEWHGTFGQLMYTYLGRAGTRVFVGVSGFVMVLGGLVMALRLVE
jgi:hypothetical protein